MVKWFKKAVEANQPNDLNGWNKEQSSSIRRSKALSSRPRNWDMNDRYRSAGQALLALSNVTQDKETKSKAKSDSEYFLIN